MTGRAPWRLGRKGNDYHRPPITGPLEAGFDEHFGVPQNHNDPFRVFIENHDLVGRRAGEAFRPVPNWLPEGIASPRCSTSRVRPAGCGRRPGRRRRIPGWPGHVTNGPWHDGKGTPYEGGHRVPFIARWPGRIAPDSSSDRLLCLTDLLATVAELLGFELPAAAGEDSFSLLPVLLGTPPAGPVRTPSSSATPTTPPWPSAPAGGS
jgi:hypothetical protein